MITAAGFCFALPAAAGEEDPLPEYLDRFEEFSEGTRKFLENWADRLGPALEDLGPKLEELAEKLGDWSLYEAPEILPNGDIIIRRKKSLELKQPAPKDGSIDL